MNVRTPLLGACLLALSPSLYAAEGGLDKPLRPAGPGALNVLVFWSDHCGNCAQVLKGLGKIRDKFGAAPVRFYAVNVDAGDATVPVRANRIVASQFEALDPADLLRRYEVTEVPWVLITQRDGRVVATPSLLNHPTAVPAYVEMELIFRGLANPRGAQTGNGHAAARSAGAPAPVARDQR